jgi:NAD(P)-dependent dehydrogenase (short-subunit alcohol dehydrogenase family)
MKARNVILPAAAAWGAAAYVIRSRKAAARPQYSFRDRAALITGGSRGLGLLIARELASEGARLAIVARNREELDRAAEDLRERGAAGVLPIRADVGDRMQAQNAVRQTVEHFGRLDLLVNDAGIIQSGPLEHMTLDDFEQAMAVHLWGPLYTLYAALPTMRRQGEGRIVNISSIGGKIAVPHLLPYSTSKFALAGLSDGLRAELAPHNIHVTTVTPGLMRTGSPVNALFKGQHKREFTWFALLDTLPLTSIDAQRAARQIVEAAREGKRQLTITFQARAAILGSHLFPELSARIMEIYARLLPGPAGEKGDEVLTGWDSAPEGDAVLLQPMYRAAAENNETVARPDGVRVLPGGS